MRSPNLKLALVFLLLVGLSALLLLNKSEMMLYVKNVLEWEHLGAALWLGLTSCFIVHYMSIFSDDSYQGGIIYKHFGKFADSAFASITYGLASSTSASILKGVYVQQFFSTEVYFKNFDDIDIWSMLVVCLFLLGYSIYAGFNALRTAIFNTQTEVAVGISS
ncbi:hypothetical protein [Pseudoalteromonas rubra]|uniref:Uncharacterized protein n=1 Tax=Pseudoalteromonas rubra TaxID=43658 RepID=A0A0F4QK93_9GAMM|nr:hypothetical protein [Pseudoalteromonas rubra]KJZ07077.1 hypothetical protein TW77_16460 [Pseudoalteromonas rubra]